MSQGAIAGAFGWGSPRSKIVQYKIQESGFVEGEFFTIKLPIRQYVLFFSKHLLQIQETG